MFLAIEQRHGRCGMAPRTIMGEVLLGVAGGVHRSIMPVVAAKAFDQNTHNLLS